MPNKSRNFNPIAMSVLCSLYGTPVFSDTLPTLEETTTESSEIKASTKLEQQELQTAPHNNVTVSQALKNQSRIGIDDGQISLQGGDLTPEEISISGARPHQTKYTIGGVGINNITTFSSDNSNNGTLSSGHTSGYFLDTTLLETIEVMDHNIDPEFGGFTGGVVNAELRKPTDEFKLEYQLRMTDSDWNSDPKVNSKQSDDFKKSNNGEGKYHPKYQKRLHSLHLSGSVNANQKVAINLSKQESDIPQNSPQNIDQSVDNVFLTHIWEDINWRTTSDLRFSQFSNNSYINNLNKDYQEDSKMEQSHIGIGGTFKVERFTNFGIWDTSLSYDRLIDKRKSDADYFRSNIVMEPGKFTRSTSGGYGDLEQYQDSVQFKSVARFDSAYLGDTRHTVNLGVDGAFHTATAKRDSSHLTFSYTDRFGSKSARNMTYFEAGSYDADTNQVALFIKDEMAWNRLTLGLGSRLEYNDLFNETTISPRLTAGWDFSQVKTNRVTLGASRYYSNALLGWALRAKGNSLRSRGDKCTPNDGNWDSNDRDNYTCQSNENYGSISMKDAETPYSDELSAIWDVDVDNFAVTTAYTYREQRKGLSFKKDMRNNSQEVLNNVESDTHIVSLDVSTIDAYQLGTGFLTANLNVAYSKLKGTGNTSAKYDDNNNLDAETDEWVVLDGQLIRTSEMETGGYQSPVKGSLSMVTFWPQSGVALNNRVNYEQGKDLTIFNGSTFIDVNNDGTSEMIKRVNTAKMDDLITWDMSVNWTPVQWDNHATFGLSVTNVLDTSAKVSTSGLELGKIDRSNAFYNKGREIWLSVSLRN